MKKIFFILSFILVSIISFAQRQRTTAMFDADTVTNAKSGMYGIGIRDSQPFLIDSKNNTDAIRFKVEHKYIVGVQLNSSDTIEYPGGNYQGRRTEFVSLNKDSLTVTLPNRHDTLNFNRNISFVYWGFSGTLFHYYDNTYCVKFSDTIFVKSGDNTYFFVPGTCIGSMTTAPNAVTYGIKPGHSFVLSEMDRRWYLHFNGIDY
ncbi:MAG TPA: hypothetical protein PKZ75_12930 [Bacteroidia bacterium]|nr:hypothetical protein [Bacteroidia bacterium]